MKILRLLRGNRYERERKYRDGPQNERKYLYFLVFCWLVWLLISSHFTNLFVGIVVELRKLGNSDVLKALLFDEDWQAVDIQSLLNALDLKNFSSWKNLVSYPVLWLSIESVLLLIMLPLDWKSWRKHHPQVGNQYGSARFTTPKELMEQYSKIPDKIETFDGYGGMPMSHVEPTLFQKLLKKAKGFYLIDRSTVNSLIVAISRAGKGETLIVPLIDILSRASKRCSMFITDTKSELYKMSYKILRKRGYRVEILNLQNTDLSASYNPLQVVIDYAKDGYFDEVQEEVNKFSTSIYHDPNAKDKFWQDSSINLLNSMILALLDLAKRNNDWKSVTMDNILHLLTDLGGEEVFFNKEGNIIPPQEDIDRGLAEYEPDRQVAEKRNKLSFYFDLLRDLNKKEYSDFRQMALDAFVQSKFAGSEAHGSIYSTTMQGIKLYQQSNIAKLTSLNSLDFTEMGFPRILKLKLGPSDHFRKIPLIANITFLTANGEIIEKRSQRFDKLGFIRYTLKAKLPTDFKVLVSFDHHNNPDEYRNWYLVLSGHKKFQMQNFKIKRDKYSKEPLLKETTFEILENQGLELKEIDLKYSERPVAIFFVTPPNNESYNDLAAFAIDQAFTQLSKLSFENEGHVYRRVHFILDEFGNLPAINNMHTKLSIGLSQELLFNIILQNLEQMELHYTAKQAATIEGNCGNLFYILTQSKQTAENISAKIGKKTVRVDTTSGKVADAHNVNESTQFIGQPLISAPELMNLMEGEMVVLRSILRRDLNGDLVSALPIFNHGRYRMPNRWENIRNQFDDRIISSDLALNSLHRNFDLKKERLDFDKVTNQLLQKNRQEQKEILNEELERLSNNDEESVFSINDQEISSNQIFTSNELADDEILLSASRILNQFFKQVDILENPEVSEALESLREDNIGFWRDPVNNSWESIREWIGDEERLQHFSTQIEKIKMKGTDRE